MDGLAFIVVYDCCCTCNWNLGITNVNHSSETVEKEVYKKGKKILKSFTYNQFCLSAMGDKLYCSMNAIEENEAAIQGLKNKIREKKNA